jgi:hypothetical protein
MTLDENKIEILRRVEQGTLSIEEGAHLLEILEGGAGSVEPSTVLKEEFVTNSSSEEGHEKLSVPAGWRAIWGIFLWLGVIFMGLSGYWLLSSYNRSGLGVGFWFALFFLLISCAIVYFGLQLLASKWMVLKIRGEDGDETRRINIWVPLPMQLASWFFRTFGSHLPESVKSRHIDDILAGMENSMAEDEPYVVEIDGQKGTSANINIEF